MYNTHTLKNNLRVILSPRHETSSVTVLVLFGVGSRYETKKLNGGSHFVEHLMFKGTTKRPTTLDISKALDSVGAQYNAYTSKDYTGYYIKIASQHIELALDILSDMLLNSKYDGEEIEREKNVICEEIRMYQDNPLMYIDTLLEQIMFPESELGWDIAGDTDTVKAMTREELVEYRDAHYKPQNAVLGIAGNYGDNVNELVQKYFEEPFKDTGDTPKYKGFTSPEQKEPQIIAHYKETEQAQLALGFRGYEYGHQDIYALALLSIILGGPMSSRLFINVRERHGLCYSIRASAESYQDTGVFSIQAGLDKTRVQKAIEVILDELKRLRTEEVLEEEMSRAKDYLAGQLALSLEGTEKLVTWYVNQALLTDEVLAPEEKMEKIRAVTGEDIQRVAKDVFNNENMHLALIGPFKDNEQFKNILSLER